MERIWPHLQRGEGHFAAILCNRDNVNIESSRRRFDIPEKSKNAPKQVREAFNLYAAFAMDFISDLDLGVGEPLLFGDQLYWLPHAPNCPFHEGYLQGIKVLRPGLHLGTVKKNRLEPAHALALALPKKGAVNEYSLSAESPEIINYLRGESIPSDNLNLSWVLVSVNDYAVGWGKENNGQIKNHFPKGLRWVG
jgi:NOL1/NOP2/fmu family ribosome biogenesis protein